MSLGNQAIISRHASPFKRALPYRNVPPILVTGRQEVYLKSYPSDRAIWQHAGGGLWCVACTDLLKCIQSLPEAWQKAN